MDADADVAGVAGLLADPGRVAMLDALLDGRALSAGELARCARVTAPTASAHLRRLLDSGLLVVQAQGRHRYYRLAGPAVAEAMEALSVIAPPRPVRSLRQSQQAQALRFARTCYDHLAGAVGVAVTDALVRAGALRPVGDRDYDLTGQRRLEPPEAQVRRPAAGLGGRLSQARNDGWLCTPSSPPDPSPGGGRKPSVVLESQRRRAGACP